MFRTPTRLPVSPSTRPVLRSVAQLGEHRSPKPGVAGSIPAGPVRAATEFVAALRMSGRIDCRVLALLGRSAAIPAGPVWTLGPSDALTGRPLLDPSFLPR